MVTDRRPNIVLIVWHDLGDWLGCYGHAGVRSPHLDRLAAEGVLLERFFSAGAVCSPGRAALMTGLMPHATGVHGLVGRGFAMKRDVTPLPRLLRDAGYTTHLFGLQHECLDPQWEGYEEIRSDQSGAAWCAAQAEQFLADVGRRAAGGAGRRPFFLAIGTHDVHRPYGEEYDPAILEQLRREPVPAFLPDAEVTRLDLATFFSRIQEADQATGRVLTALERNGLADKTLVLFTTDHGAQLPRAKVTLYDPGIKVAFLARWPGRITAGARYDALVSNVDVVPTLCDLLDIAPPLGLHGRSFAPLLTNGGAYEEREAVFAEFTWSTVYRPMRAVRTATHKLIRNFEPGLPSHIGGGDIVRYGTDLIEQTYGHPVGPVEFYDLIADPFEQHDLSSDPRHAVARDTLIARLDAHLRATGDPILEGPIPNPGSTRTHPPIWVQVDGRFRLKRPAYWETARP